MRKLMFTMVQQIEMMLKITLFLINVKVDEGYWWIKGYINEDFMQESILKKISRISET